MTAPRCPKCDRPLRARSKTPTGRTRWECRRPDGSGGEVYCYSTTSAERVRARGPRRVVFKRDLRGGRGVYIITSAQNGTPIHEVFWRCLQRMAKHRKAELLVVPIRYKNPTSRWTASQANEEHWADEVHPYLWNQRKALGPNLVLLGDVKTQPTAQRPLAGFEGMTAGASCILGHTKLELVTVPAPGHRMPKIMTTTGACTVANYTDSKAGKLGAFHHALAACVVEVVGRRFHLRQLNFDTHTQSFTDVGTRYYEDRVESAPRPLALVMGDTHCDMISPSVVRATWGAGGIVPTLKPERLVWHDLVDGYSVNPHHRGNPFIAIAKAKAGRGDARAEIERACHFVKARTPAGASSVIVPSNHNDFFRRWLATADWKMESPENAELYLELALQTVRAARFKDGFGAEYPSPVTMMFPRVVDCSNIKLLDGLTPYAVAGIELSMHGHLGPNGARGSIMNHRRLGVRSFIGHSHTPGIQEGCYQVGTSTELAQEYTAGGPSSWLNCHGLLNADGKRQLLVIVDGHWRN